VCSALGGAARTFTPLEHRAEGLTETSSKDIGVGDQHDVPLEIPVDQGGMRFNWAFQVSEPGLRLFAARRSQVAATVDQVEVNGVEVKRIAPESLRVETSRGRVR